MGNIIECGAQIPFWSNRKLLPPGVKETQYRIWFGKFSFEPDRMWPRREVCVCHGSECSIRWVWLGRAAREEEEKEEGSEWLSEERCRCSDWVLTDSCGGNLYLIWLDTGSSESGGAHNRACSFYLAHTQTHFPSLVCSPCLCLSHSLLVTKSFCLLTAHASLRFPPPLPLLPFCFLSLSTFLFLVIFLLLFSFYILAFYFTYSLSYSADAFICSLSLCYELSTFLEWEGPLGAEPWTLVLSGPL